MEEGPEPQEWVERAAEEKHHGAGGHEAKPPDMVTSAVTAAILAVLAAIGSLLSGHAVNEAILSQTKATDQWAYYQAKSTKGHVDLVGAELLTALAGEERMAQAESVQSALKQFRAESARYDKEKEDIKHEAEHLDHESQHELHKHQQFALGIVCFQVGIVLASVSILIHNRAFYVMSLVAGVVGVVWLVVGLIM